MKRLAILLLGLALSTPAFAGERAEPVSDQDWAAFEANCQSSPDCARDLATLKRSVDRYEAELQALCEQGTAACAQRLDQEANEQRQRFAVCDAPETCVATLNRDMEAREITLEQSSWCAKRPASCEKQKQARTERNAKGLSWCDSYKSVCDRAFTEAQQEAQTRARREAQLNAERKRAQASKAETEKQVILGNLDQWLEQQARCEGDDEAKCIESINARLEQSERNVEESYCKESDAICDALKQRREARSEAKQTWCEAHAGVCKQAHGRAAQTHRALVAEADRVEKLCSADSDSCDAARRSSYDALVNSEAKCESHADQCREEIETRIVARQMELAKGPWCVKHRAFCDREAADLSARLDKRETWCAQHEPVCATAERTQREKEQMRQQAERAKIATEWEQGLKEVAAAVAATCAPASEAACIDKINVEVKHYFERSKERWCNGNPQRASRCEVLRGARAAVGEKYCASGRNDCRALLNGTRQPEL